MAEPLTIFTALPAPFLRDNVDTDQIIPSREMKSTGKTGLADGLFAGHRYTKIGGRDPDPDFVLNKPAYSGSQVLLSGRNFGCGSSREHAVWALAEYGIRAIIAESFAPIFAGNAVRNGVLPLALDRAAIDEIAAANSPVTIDLPAQTVMLDDDHRWDFTIAEEARAMLTEGLDAIDLTLKNTDSIAAWQQADRQARPWIYLGDPT
ncbi:3-isopropylmalate dehydratase small subunit [Parasphingopyxis sp. CP4]|uniref:3-isopropylmalate dehydratase small subunit n=1 Tax=Parasphingopyxis sp. CP4 TaxID=2724527 RepID=UPI0015A03568|nr:3-isopropylmalate dehydratase small subunit [Parasphingopyxis sp. CP4]QLC23063.1 3-isopropylmalate dehydratase small subunit [Parasphingopyxis sp. CP4]